MLLRYIKQNSNNDRISQIQMTGVWDLFGRLNFDISISIKINKHTYIYTHIYKQQFKKKKKKKIQATISVWICFFPFNLLANLFIKTFQSLISYFRYDCTYVNFQQITFSVKSKFKQMCILKELDL